MNLNGIKISSVGPTRGSGLKVVTLFVPLPRQLWRFSGAPGCNCGKCDGVGYWDTLALCSTPSRDDRTDTTWTVHHPELHASTSDGYRAISIGAGYRMVDGKLWVKDSL